jgi:hypothetical protein
MSNDIKKLLYKYSSKPLIGEAVILVPFDKEWEVFMHGLNSFSNDFMSEGRMQDAEHERVYDVVSDTQCEK